MVALLTAPSFSPYHVICVRKMHVNVTSANPSPVRSYSLPL